MRTGDTSVSVAVAGNSSFSFAGAGAGRLKREDCNRTKHDSAFSDWKILIGPSDWEDYSLGKEGAGKYRTQNLPNCASCSGVYELGITVSQRQSGREASGLDPDFIVPVYVGKSDNVRTRMQQYGREGAHLENGRSNEELHGHDIVSGLKGAKLFTGAFSRGFSIVYRWAPMSDKKDAAKTEAQLLANFDYAWNKDSNGARRHSDVFHKLDRISRATRVPAFIRKLQLSFQKPKGVSIKVCEPLSLDDGADFYSSFKSTGVFAQIFKFGRSRPRIASSSFGESGHSTDICGVALGHGSVCIRPPVNGNKRCADHKGMKVNGLNSKLIAVGNSSATTRSMRPSTDCGEGNAPIHGLILDSCVPSEGTPVQENVRHLEHEGRETHHFVQKPVTNKNELGTSVRNESQQSLAFSSSLPDQEDHSVRCGVDLKDGTLCTKQPVAGRKRCEEHKGRRVKDPNSKLVRAEIPSLLSSPTTQSFRENEHSNISIPLVDKSPTCGATLRNGSFCRRKLSEGNKRCWQHRGMRAEMSP